MAHATLRAIAMVAQKRRTLAQQDEGTASTRTESTDVGQPFLATDAEPFSSNAINELEERYVSASNNLSRNGYLCLDLEIYLTHEPCVMCAMAILHSRFSRVIFGKRMVRSGALCAEDASLGHGLFWRDQLNWKFLAWQWQPASHLEDDDSSEEDFHV